MSARPVRPSPTLATDQRVRELITSGRRVVHLAFGEAGLPVHPVLREMLDAAASRNAYPPVAGTPAARDAAAGWFGRRGVACDAGSVILAPGSKPLPYALLLALDGDLLLPKPSWVSYAAQARLAGKQVVQLPIPAAAGGVPDPDALREWAAGHRGRRATVLLTVPDNPTGTMAGRELVQDVCDLARENEWWIVSDEIYRDLAYAPESLVSPGHLLPERTVVTAGLSKHLALGGWRIGFARFPATAEGARARSAVEAIASEVWSAMAGPMQEVAAYALREPDDLRDFVESGRRLHRSVTGALHQVVTRRGATARRPTAGFYIYPDFEARRDDLRRKGVATSDELAETLLEKHDVAVLPGVVFGDDPDRLAVRMAASLLYGSDDEERWAALGSAAPLELPWIAGALERVGAALDELVGDPTP